MKYDFKTAPDRSKMGSSKWLQMQDWNPDVAPGIIPFSVADMELKHPPQLIEGLKSYLDEAILGYTQPTDSYYDALASWLKRRHNWEIDKDWVVFTPGVVFAFFEAIKAFTEPGDGILVATPAYYPFYMAIEQGGRKLVDSPLVPDDKGVYHIDFEDLEAKAKDPATKLMLFCSPHNPISRVWTRDELERVGRICMDNGVLVLSDEIHFDFVMPGHKHTVFATLSEEFRDNCIVCTAPSKSFNLAGMQCSNIIIPNEKIRTTYKDYLLTHAMGKSLNIMAYKACELAYSECEDWLDALLLHIEDCAEAITTYCAENLPKVKVTPLEGTYLLWMDFRAYGLSNEALEQIMHMEAQVFMDEGYVFGPTGDGFERINLAAPKKDLLDAMGRIKNAMSQYE